MTQISPLTLAIEQIGLKAVAETCEVTYQAVRKWEKARRLPRTEWTGETNYAARIEKATCGSITKSMLLEKWDAPELEAALA